MAYKQLSRSMRRGYLKDFGIHKVRASKSIAIYRRFPVAESVAELTVEEAYEQRYRRATSQKTRGDRREDGAKVVGDAEVGELEQFLNDVGRRADALVKTAVLADRKDRMQLISLAQYAIDRLKRLHRLLGHSDGEEMDTSAAQ